jgi:protein TonB
MGTRLAMLRRGNLFGYRRFLSKQETAHKAHKPTMRIQRLSALAAVAFVAVATHATLVNAQTANPDPAAASRVARDADNPMRVILEASKLKVRIKPETEDAPPPEKRVVRTPASRPAAVAKATAPAAAVPPGASQAAAAQAPAPVNPPAQMMAKAAESVPMPSALATPAPIVPAPKPLALPPIPLKLAQLVEPEVPSSVMRRMRSDVTVVIGLTVNADGSVSDVVIKSNPMKALDPAIIDAVRQWRYNPIDEPRTHAVQLVLHSSQ